MKLKFHSLPNDPSRMRHLFQWTLQREFLGTGTFFQIEFKSSSRIHRG
ncbi:hypothetical protein LEP1GSC194_0404 [Leptospira alstonii serovar Sichuan str. 79601]|uniref:Uncharacterized protein n=1 Tax=Leptospira alstonii serovar Sichuan str. 79601 TaxID=1218565 RepID=M6D482_9LEPT|nr:hypothetical protein LEP1GSC194_0404 [Leptospira alstonii serovar Sichuan str. 79601]